VADALRVAHAEGRDAFLVALDDVLGAVDPLDDRALLAASHCWGWAVVDVVTHVRSGLDEVAAALLGVGAAPGPPDRDAASYWSEPPPGAPGEADDPVPGIVATRRLGSASRRPSAAVAQLRAVAAALTTGVGRLEEGTLGFQGHVLTTGDFLATWAVELAVHQLDLGRDLDVPLPDARSLTLTRRTVEALLGARLPVEDDLDAVLVGTGRRTPTAAEQDRLGLLAQRLPVF
jgi:hypothetical protein